MMDARLAHFLPGAASHGDAGATKIGDPRVADLFSKAMQQSFLLPASMYLIGLLAVLFYERPKHSGYGGAAAPTVAAPVEG
jgi:hypothetical protein